MQYKLFSTVLALAILPVILFLFWGYTSVKNLKMENQSLALLEITQEEIEKELVNWNTFINALSDAQIAKLPPFQTSADKQNSKAILGFIITDHNGQVSKASTFKDGTASDITHEWNKYNFSDTIWFKQRNLNRDRSLIGPVSMKLMQTELNAPNLKVFMLTKPLWNNRNEFTGAIALFIDASYLPNMINRIVRESNLTGRIAITDKNNRQLLSSYPDQEYSNYIFQQVTIDGNSFNLYAHTPSYTFWNDYLSPIGWPLSFYFIVVIWLSLELARYVSRAQDGLKISETNEFELHEMHQLPEEIESFGNVPQSLPGRVSREEIAHQNNTANDKYTVLELMTQTISVQVNLLAVNSTVAAIGKAELSKLAMSANELSEKVTQFEQNILKRIHRLRSLA